MVYVHFVRSIQKRKWQMNNFIYENHTKVYFGED